MTQEMTNEEKWNFAESIFAGEQKEEIKRMRAEEEAQPEPKPEPEPEPEQTSEGSERLYTLHFYAEDGKAIAKAIFGDEEHEIEIESRAHAVRIAKRAVSKANADEKPIEFFHGFESDGLNPFEPQFERTCLGAQAYNEVWAELDNRKPQYQSAFKPTW